MYHTSITNLLMFRDKYYQSRPKTPHVHASSLAFLSSNSSQKATLWRSGNIPASHMAQGMVPERKLADLAGVLFTYTQASMDLATVLTLGSILTLHRAQLNHQKLFLFIEELHSCEGFSQKHNGSILAWVQPSFRKCKELPAMKLSSIHLGRHPIWMSTSASPSAPPQ